MTEDVMFCCLLLLYSVAFITGVGWREKPFGIVSCTYLHVHCPRVLIFRSYRFDIDLVNIIQVDMISDFINKVEWNELRRSATLESNWIINLWCLVHLMFRWWSHYSTI